MSTKDVDEAIATYRKQLVAEAELAGGDLDEIEDHLRALTDDLRATGMPTAAAVTEAARRLGDPVSVAREHARVRTPFGATISRARAWSVAALLLPMIVWNAVVFIPYTGVWSRFGAEILFGAVLIIALIARVAWARPILLGGLAFYFVSTIHMTVAYGINAIFVVWHLGMLAFLLPWRRAELTTAGKSLALQVWTYCAAGAALGYQYTTPEGEHGFITPTALVALIAAVIATSGQILRARWGALASAVSSVMLGVAVFEMLGMEFVGDLSWSREIILAQLGSGVLAAAISSLLAWRTARSTLGTFQHVFR